MSEELKLLPCPFCGAPARILPHLGGPGCPYATCSAECYIGDLAMMAEDWNRRVPPPAPAWTGEPNEFRVMYRKHGVTSERCWLHATTLAEAEADARRIGRKPDTQRAWIESRVMTMWQEVAGPIPEQPEGEKP